MRVLGIGLVACIIGAALIWVGQPKIGFAAIAMGTTFIVVWFMAWIVNRLQK